MKMHISWVVLGFIAGFSSSLYADIASVGYVNEVAGTKQDKLPTTTNNGGKVLKVNSAGTGVEWANDSDTKVTLQGSTGTSTSDGMTQKAITDALDSIDVSQVRSGGATSNTLVNMWIE